MSRQRICCVAVFLGVIYALLPVAAGYFGIGDRAGPRVYPMKYHQAMFLLGSDLSGAGEKPRISASQRSQNRPWFYGTCVVTRGADVVPDTDKDAP